MQTHELLTTLEGHSLFVTSLAFPPESDRLASTSLDGGIRLWTLDDSHHLSLEDCEASQFRSIAVSDCGTFLVAADYATHLVAVYDLAMFSLLTRFSNHTSQFWAVASSPCGSFILSGSWDKILRTWFNPFKFRDQECLQPEIEGRQSSKQYAGLHWSGSSRGDAETARMLSEQV